MRNHKGDRCIVSSSVFCQEGYCPECAIADPTWAKGLLLPIKPIHPSPKTAKATPCPS